MLMEQKESSHLFLLPVPPPIVVLFFFLALLHIFEILQQFMVSQDVFISRFVKS